MKMIRIDMGATDGPKVTVEEMGKHIGMGGRAHRHSQQHSLEH